MGKLFMRLETNVEIELDDEITSDDPMQSVKNMTALDTKMYISEDCINWMFVDGLELAEQMTEKLMGLLGGLTGGMGS